MKRKTPRQLRSKTLRNISTPIHDRFNSVNISPLSRIHQPSFKTSHKVPTLSRSKLNIPTTAPKSRAVPSSRPFPTTKSRPLAYKPPSQQPPTPPTPNIPSFSEVVINNFYGIVSTYPDTAKSVVREWINKTLDELGGDLELFSEMLEEAMSTGNIATYKEAYDLQTLYQNLLEMLNFLDVSAAEKNNIINSLDWINDFNGEIYDLDF